MEDVIVIFAQEYTRFIGNSWHRLLETIFWLLVIRQVYELLGAIFPFIKGLANTIFIPFRVLHVWFHVQAVKNLNSNRKKLGRKSNTDQISLGLAFRTGLGIGKEGSSLNIFSVLNNDLEIREAMYIANAPTLPGFALLIATALAGPLMTASILPIIHLYLILGISIALLPSSSDTLYIINTIIVKTKISVWYIVFIPIIFFISAGIYSLKYEIIGYYPEFWWLEPVIMGVWSAWVYILLLSFVIYFTNINQSVESIFIEKDEEKNQASKDADYVQTIQRRKQMLLLDGEDESIS